ncbi:cytochrome c [Billgrantia diversa]|uniref:c-type cytochrome n=1 Tax=Halomonas sp. MCCC 1A13316 TaxID=2733487 RepID=UPI0018A483D0|nr:cytochrome c [Halomonas sp. MCCC 1A13316]QOR37214.1 cytochrome c [Halomonas sp. MCCC 1A13316]
MPMPAFNLLLMLAFCWFPVAVLADGTLSTERKEELETLLYQDCGSCHGMTLRGGLGPSLPRDRMATFSREALAHIILQGIPGSAMPGWKALISDADARWLAEHLQTDNPLETLAAPPRPGEQE